MSETKPLKYKISRIDEPEFGCEGRPDGKPAMAVVFLQDDSGKETVIAYEDAELYMLNLNEGDYCYYIEDEGLRKSMTELSNLEAIEIAGQKCHVYMENEESPFIYWPMQMHETDDVERMINLIKLHTNIRSINLIAFEANDWNADFSPWPSPAAFGNEAFKGEGDSTLEWLIKVCILHIEGKVLSNKADSKPVRFIAGYSLAGLFALWAFYQCDYFAGAASCSGSLWYPNWMQFVERMNPPEDSIVYLSLGTKEEKTKNQTMAKVGDATREMAEQLKRDANIKDSVLEWNPGGHFNNPAERTAKGIAWLLNHVMLT